jgi:hypothetical protein
MNDANSQPGHERCGGRTRAGTPCKLPAGHGTVLPRLPMVTCADVGGLCRLPSGAGDGIASAG